MLAQRYRPPTRRAVTGERVIKLLHTIGDLWRPGRGGRTTKTRRCRLHADGLLRRVRPDVVNRAGIAPARDRHERRCCIAATCSAQWLACRRPLSLVSSVSRCQRRARFYRQSDDNRHERPGRARSGWLPTPAALHGPQGHRPHSPRREGNPAARRGGPLAGCGVWCCSACRPCGAIRSWSDKECDGCSASRSLARAQLGAASRQRRCQQCSALAARLPTSDLAGAEQQELERGVPLVAAKIKQMTGHWAPRLSSPSCASRRSRWTDDLQVPRGTEMSWSACSRATEELEPGDESRGVLLQVLSRKRGGKALSRE